MQKMQYVLCTVQKDHFTKRVFFIVFRLLRISRRDPTWADTSGGRYGQVRIPQVHQRNHPQRQDRISLRQGIPAHWSSSCDLCQRTVESTWIAHLESTCIASQVDLNYPPGVHLDCPPRIHLNCLPGVYLYYLSGSTWIAHLKSTWIVKR